MELRDNATRGLVLAWCLWLLGCWGVTLGMSSMIPPSRWMIVSCLIGMMALWPVFRLSQDLTVRDPRRGVTGMTLSMVWTDWVCLVLVFQAVVWPLRLMSGWTLAQTAWLDGQVLAWSLLTGAVVAIGCGGRNAVSRGAAMLACVLLLLGEPLLLALLSVAGIQINGHHWALQLTPIQSVWQMSGAATDWRAVDWGPNVVAVALAAVAAWIGAWLWRRAALGMPGRGE